MLSNGQLIKTTSREAIGRSGHTVKHYWWGVRHILSSDAAARKYVYELRTAARFSYAAGAIGALVFPGMAAVNALTAIYADAVADCVDYNAGLRGRGVTLDINWFLIYTCNPN